jgi:hypothetical protein
MTSRTKLRWFCPNVGLTLYFLFICILSKTITAVAAEVNVAAADAGALAIADSEYGSNIAGRAIDGTRCDSNTGPECNRWHAAIEKLHPHWLWIRFRQPARISKVVIHRADLVDYPVELVGEYTSDAGITFRTLFTVSDNQMSEDQFTIERSFPPVVTDNFRVRILRSSQRERPNSAQLSEVEVSGEPVEEKVVRERKSPPIIATDPMLLPSAFDGLKITSTAKDIQFRSRWLRLVVSKQPPRISAICWDSLGAGKVNENLLKPAPASGVGFSCEPLFPADEQSAAEPTPKQPVISEDGNVVRCAPQVAGNGQGRWELRVEPKSFQIRAISTTSNESLSRDQFGVNFAFDLGKSPIAPLTNPRPAVSAPLPCLLHAADYGSLLVRTSQATSEAQLVGSAIPTDAQWNAFIGSPMNARPSDGLIAIPAGTTQIGLDFSVEDDTAPLPELTRHEPRLQTLSRSWLNTFQYRPDIGILSNNIVSDNAIFCMFGFTDPAIFTPVLPGQIEPIQLARESLDRYFAGAHGYGVGMENRLTDTYPSVLIAAWDVIRVTGDRELLRRWLPKLEEIGAKAEAQDRDGNGLPESTLTGVSDDHPPAKGNWWDQINFGHEDAYVCALSYRAFLALADLERFANRPDSATHFERRAERIRAAYVPTFLNPKTGILAGWKDAHGELHDYWFVFINGMAITYALVDDDLANSIVDRIEAKMKEVGFTRFDLGLPGNLVPVRKIDYGRGALGSPEKEDGTDTFGVFENGGASACYAYFYIQALYQLGRREEAERILWPMMRTFAEGGFQNGIGHGGEWRHWDGTPSGYEGFLADAYYAQMAVFTGHYGIGFGPEGFHLEKWSPLKGQEVPLNLKYMGAIVDKLK